MSYQTALLALSPTAYWRLGEAVGATTAADSSGNSHTLTKQGTSVTFGTTGLLTSDADTAVTTAGTGYLNTPASAGWSMGTGDFTLIFWWKGTSSGTAVGIGQSAGANPFWFGMSGTKLNYNFNSASHTGSININDGVRHMCVLTRVSGACKTYVDGVVDATGQVTDAAAFGNATQALGVAAFDSGSFPMLGVWDEVAIFKGTGLSQSQITTLWDNGRGAFPGSFTSDVQAIDPHTTGIVVTLTGVETTWDGTTVFTVSGVSGVTKTAQNVASATSATITLTTGTSAGTLTISDGNKTLDIQVSTYKVIRDSVAGTVQYPGTAFFLVVEPASYDGNTARPLVFYHHGAGEDREWLLTDSLKTGIVNQLVADGCLLASCTGGASHWGSANAMNQYAKAHPHILATWNVSKVVLWPQSMGGLTAFQAIRNPTVFALIAGVYSVYPACSILAAYDDVTTFRTDILTAWSAADRTALGVAVTGFNPTDLSAAGYPNILYRFHASAGDTVILKSHNTDAMRTVLGGRVENSLVVTSGNHGDASNFDPADASAFVTRAMQPATLDQDGQTVNPGDTLTGTYAGFTPTGGMVAGTAMTGFTASAGTWSGVVGAGTTLGAGAAVILSDGTSSPMAGTVTVEAAPSTLGFSRFGGHTIPSDILDRILPATVIENDEGLILEL